MANIDRSNGKDVKTLMNHDPLISIIIPIYGTEQYLSECIESVLAQTYSRLQVILVDDQSPDGCPAICDAYARKDPRILAIHQKNTGVSGARNTGIRHADGEYIMFVDSDDALYPTALELMLRDCREYGADVVSAIKNIVDENGRIIGTCDDGALRVYSGEEALLLSLGGDRNTNSACAKLFKADFLSGILFDEGKHVNEDGFFVFQCYLRNPLLVQHNLPVYRYNVRPGSSSRQRFSDRSLSMLYFCERKKELIARHAPQFLEQAYNMEVRTNLQFLDILCGASGSRHKLIQQQGVKTVRELYAYHKPIHDHHKKLAWIVKSGLYPLYRLLVRIRYY